MKQKIVIEEIEINNEEILVKAVRLFSVEEVRSAFLETFKITIRRISRSEMNPYGLILTGVEIKKREEKIEKK